MVHAAAKQLCSGAPCQAVQQDPVANDKHCQVCCEFRSGVMRCMSWHVLHAHNDMEGALASRRQGGQQPRTVCLGGRRCCLACACRCWWGRCSATAATASSMPRQAARAVLVHDALQRLHHRFHGCHPLHVLRRALPEVLKHAVEIQICAGECLRDSAAWRRRACNAHYKCASCWTARRTWTQLTSLEQWRPDEHVGSFGGRTAEKLHGLMQHRQRTCAHALADHVTCPHHKLLTAGRRAPGAAESYVTHVRPCMHSLAALS